MNAQMTFYFNFANYYCIVLSQDIMFKYFTFQNEQLGVEVN